MRFASGLMLSVLVAGCGDGGSKVRWTIGRQPASEACALLSAPTVQINVVNSDSGDSRGVTAAPTTQVVPCADGEATISAADYARVTVDLLDGTQVVGSAASTNVTPAQRDVGVDVLPSRGVIAVDFTANGQNCEDAGVGSLTVTVREYIEPLASVIVAENVAVACDGGAARYQYVGARIGTTYAFVATDGADLATPSSGVNVRATSLRTTATVDLDTRE
jgi:hypothetical protein